MRTTRVPIPGGGVDGHNGTKVTHVVLREPSYDEYLDHGHPYEIVRAAGGAPVFVENGDAIRAYLSILVVEPADPLVLKRGGFRLAAAMKEALFDFFLSASAEDAASSTLPTSSSSPASPPSTSALSIV